MARVNPTRMELLKLKRRITLARRGHKLLQDKEEQLLIEFRKLVSKIRQTRKKMEQELINFYTCVLSEKGVRERTEWESALYTPGSVVTIKVLKEKIFNLPMQKITLDTSETRSQLIFDYPSISFLYKYGEKILRGLLTLNNLENELYTFSDEIERTRRRVNALEHVLIPHLQETIRFITFKLSEAERTNLVRLKHIQLLKT